MRTFSIALLASVGISCSQGDVKGADAAGDVPGPDGEVVEADSGPDADAPAENPADAQPDDAADLATDAPDDAPDATPDVPLHAKVYERRTRAVCLPDGPYDVDRVAMARDAAHLPDLDVRSALAAHGKAWMGTATGLFVAAAGDATFTRVDLGVADAPVADLDLSPEGEVLAATGKAVVRVAADGKVAGVLAADADVDKVFACTGKVWAVAGGALLSQSGAGLVPDEQPPGAPAHDGACKPGAPGPWVGTDTGLWTRPPGGAWDDSLQGSGDAPVLLVAHDGDMLAIATTDSVRILYPVDIVMAPGVGALPAGAITSLDLDAAAGTVAIGHTVGATLVTLAETYWKAEHWHSLRWLPAEAVRAVALSPAPSPALWAGTGAGASRIAREPTTLAAKADRMMQELDAHFWRMGGFVSTNASFPDPWSDGPASLWDDDNDGQWTEEAVAAFCYAYATTGDERWYAAARKAVTNMMMLIDVPAPDFEGAGLGRGFVTRSLVRDDEGDVFASKATQANWHLVHHTDGHDYYWKDDTSSDETTGHFYGLPLYFDLCAKDDAERALVAEHVTALAGYILDHGYLLIDLDGQRTEHGYWSPETIGIAVDGPEACVSAGHEAIDCIDAYGGGAYLNSVEILGAMLAAWHVSGEQRFYDAYESLVTVHRYDELATFADHVATWTVFPLANYCDHELADLAFLTLLRYDPNPDRRGLWAQSMLAAYTWEAGERNPLKSLALAATLEEVPGLAEGVRTLVDYPEDLRQILYDNGHRMDAEVGPPDRHGDEQFRTVFPHDEIAVQRWDSNPYAVSGGGSPNQHRSPAFWLLPYWGLRYHGAICP
jgi:hypothetical protein